MADAHIEVKEKYLFNVNNKLVYILMYSVTHLKTAHPHKI